MKKLRKNKFLILGITVIIVSIVYFLAQKAIDNYNFKMNNDLVVEDETEVGDFGGESQSKENEGEQDADKVDGGVIDEEETNLELEGSIEEEATDGAVVAEEGESGAEEGVQENGESEEVAVIERSKIYVYITGEVNVPGVVVLNEGSRIVDAINAAGGTTAKADISKVNLVYVLDDGMKVNIPNSNDLKNNPNFEYITMNSGDGGDPPHGSDNDVGVGNGGAGGGVSNQGSSNSSSSKRFDIVNINTASQTELETLPGIGPSLALKIINYRKQNGKFSSIEQIKDVSGIGESKFENLKNYITI